MISIPKSLPDCISDPARSTLFDIPSGATSFIFQKGHFLVRIWRTTVRELDVWELRRRMAFLEVTDLSGPQPSPRGLHWSYSRGDGEYVLHGHVGGSTKHRSLKELYDRCTWELEYFVKKVGRKTE